VYNNYQSVKMWEHTLNQNAPLQVLIQSVFSPTAFDFWASHLNPTWSWQRPLARIVARRIAAKDCVTLTLKPNRHAEPFLAGQHINITTEINGVRYTRSYSPSLLPDQNRVFTITVKRMSGGKVSNWLYEQAQIGQVIELGAAFGDMTLSSVYQKHVFLAAGSGITPFLSLVREWVAQGALGDMTLIYWAKTKAELCFVDEFAALAAQYANLQIHYALTQEQPSQVPQTHIAYERLSQRLLETLVPDLNQRVAYACGPAGFVEQARLLTQEQAKDFYGEAFSLPLVANERLESVNIHLTKSNRTIRVASGQPLLAALEAQGLKPASGCRMGICNTCVCIKQAGTTEHILTQARDHEAGSSVRICISSARSDLTLDL
jgi:ferredoxin-NADP reductase